MNKERPRVRRAVILAAGKSKRLESLNLAQPKPTIEVAGKALIVHHLEQCSRCGIEEVFINLHYRPEQIQAVVGDGSQWNLNVTCHLEPVLAGTSGGVKGFMAYLHEDPFLVIYGDNYFTFSLMDLIDAHFATSQPPDMSIALFDLDDVSQSGVALCDENGFIISFTEKPQVGSVDSHLVNAGVYVMEPTLLSTIPEGISDFGQDLIPNLIATGKKILGVRMKGSVYAVDTPELLEQTRRRMNPPYGFGVADKSSGA